MSSDFTAEGGPRLAEFLDGLPVKTRWLSGHRVVWMTGQQDAPDGVGPEAETHCSAFVAAAALWLDIYVLRPPHHAQELLANAQVAWLNGDGAFDGPTAEAEGWQALGLSGDEGVLEQAVAAASAGKLVVGAYAEPPVVDPVSGITRQKPGHIVIVRPDTEAFDTADGPLVMSAGTENWRKIVMRVAFEDHDGAWPSSIALFLHDTPLESDAATA